MKINFIYSFILLLSVFAISSCNKSDLADLNMSYKKIKVYNDTLIDPTNSSTRIVAGNNRLYITYGTGNIFVPGFDFFHTKLMVTDNQGNIILRDTLPTGLAMGEMLVLDDGSLLLVSYEYLNFSSVTIYVFHFGANGEHISMDTLMPGYAVAGVNGFDIINAVHVCRSINGNVLVYGGYYDLSNAETGYMIECDVNGNELWSKSYPLQISGCIVTPDNGYLFTGYAYGLQTISLRKSNAAGDLLWQRDYSVKTDGGNNPKELVRTINGNYLLAFYSSENRNGIYYAIFSVLKVNAVGDSLSSITIKGNENRHSNVFLATDDGGSFAVTNDPFNGNIVPTGIFNQINSYQVRFDADLKLKQDGYFQTQTTNVIQAGCKTSDNNIACFGIIQTYRKEHYSPMLIITK